MKLSTAQRGLAKMLREKGKITHEELKKMYRRDTIWVSGTPGPMLRLIKKGLAKPSRDGFAPTDTLKGSSKPPRGRTTSLHTGWAWVDPLD